MSFWEGIKKIFQKNEAENLEEDIREDELVYIGDEPTCFACDMGIHSSQRSRRIDGKRMHIQCFRKMTKIIKNGGGPDCF